MNWRWYIAIGLAALLVIEKTNSSHWKARFVNEEALHDRTKSDYRLAQSEAAMAAKKQRADIEARYRRDAELAEDRYAEEVRKTRSSTDAFIDANRVRGQRAECPASEAAPTPGSEGPGISTPVPASAVMVSEADVRICTEAATYALEAHRWAISLK